MAEDEKAPLDKKALILLKYKPVCICNAIRHGRVQSAIEAGAKSVSAIARDTGCTTGSCGGQRCIPVIEELLRAHGKG